MKIAIDLNDVVRDYTDNFIKTYLLNYNREYNTEELSIWTNDMESVLPFKTQRAYQKFVYEDFSYELFGYSDDDRKSIFGYVDLKNYYLHPLIYLILMKRMGSLGKVVTGEKYATVTKNLPIEINEWLHKLNDENEEIEVMFVSPMEFGPTICYTYFFLSKINCNIREVYLPIDSITIWNRCDVLITANPNLLKNCPEDKKVIKIEKEYNKDIDSEYCFKNLSSLMYDENNILKIIKNEE